MSRTKAVAGASALLLVVVAGCAGNQPVPAAGIEQAEQRIEEAERASAERYANRELNMAREKLLAAREAEQEGDEEIAARLAERAELDAAYAIAVADNQAAQEAVDEVRETLATLESELRRQQTEQPADVTRDEGDIELSLQDAPGAEPVREPAQSDPLAPEGDVDPAGPDPLDPDPLGPEPPAENRGDTPDPAL